MSLSSRTYLGLILLLSVLAAVSVFLPQGEIPGPGPHALPAPRWVLSLVNGFVMLILYGGLGWAGLILSRKLEFADLWDPGISNRKRFLLPAAAGLGLGGLFILGDTLFGALHGLGPLPHPPFPTSVVASAVAGIGEEVIFRLFFVSFWVWLIGRILLKGRWADQVFWSVALLSALAFSASHLPSVLFLFDAGAVEDLPTALLMEILLLNGALSMVAAHHLRRFGFLAAVGVHFWTDMVWHVLWGAV